MLLSSKLVQAALCSFVFFAGIACIAWGWAAFPIVLKQNNVQRLAPQVMGGQSFDLKLLESILPPTPSSAECRAPALKAAAIVRLRLAESAIELADRNLISDTQQSLRISVRDALSCAPTEAFLWFLQYWLEVTQNGFSERAVQYLRMSYALGPNEGWISIKRNGFSLAVYNQLPADLAAQVIPEFISLVRSGFYFEAAANLSGPGWPIRESLVVSLAPIEERQRYEFSKLLRRQRIDLDVPGIALEARRPWN